MSNLDVTPDPASTRTPTGGPSAVWWGGLPYSLGALRRALYEPHVFARSCLLGAVESWRASAGWEVPLPGRRFRTTAGENASGDCCKWVP